MDDLPHCIRQGIEPTTYWCEFQFIVAQPLDLCPRGDYLYRFLVRHAVHMFFQPRHQKKDKKESKILYGRPKKSNKKTTDEAMNSRLLLEVAQEAEC